MGRVWQDRTIDIAGEEIWRPSGALHIATFVVAYITSPANIAVRQQVRGVIVQKLGVDFEQINENIRINHIPNEEAYWLYNIQGDRYHVQYQYRDWKKICIAWSEVWHEHCRLKN